MTSYAVLGAGGVGGLVAGALARAGHPVTLVIRPEAEHPPVVRVDSQVLGQFEAPVTVTSHLQSPVDVLWVATKAPALGAALGQVPPGHIREMVIPLLNGIDHMAALRAAFGEDRLAAGTIRVEAEKLAPGSIRQAGGFIILELAGPDRLRPALDRVAAEIGATGIRARVVESATQALWEKLSFLGPFALTSTASGLDLGGIREDAAWRERILGALREVIAVARAEGVELADPSPMLDAAPGNFRTSMQKDAAAGRPLEVDHIAGPILRGGVQHGIPTPVTRDLVDRIRSRHPAQA